MEKKFVKQQKFFVSEEEKTLNWNNVLNCLKKLDLKCLIAG